MSERPSKKEIRAFLDDLDPAEIGGPMQAAVVPAFQRIYHHAARRTWHDVWYRGTRLHAYPTDLWVYQELLEELKPSLVVQTGTYRGGTALFLADRLQIIGRGHVVTIDAEAEPNRPQHPRLTYLTGPPTAADIVDDVRSRLDGLGPGAGPPRRRDHQGRGAGRAARAMRRSHLPARWSWSSTPTSTVRPMRSRSSSTRTSDFEVDARGERHFLTQNPAGLLRRVAGESDGRRRDRRPRRWTSTRPRPPCARSSPWSSTASEPHVVLVLQAFEPHGFFAGIKTAVLAAARLAGELGQRSPGRRRPAGPVQHPRRGARPRWARSSARPACPRSPTRCG